ncbi:hypothetical protein AAWM_02960 [Aspergillus awamori]|uniref:Uncharacterized protein n=1 Tax=Aspergillus awamori TaxID=105351 RepID=A0A401KLI0_ASPAW|nr:hypothetical protein AAWM_02960 [Aspergillus awamori]
MSSVRNDRYIQLWQLWVDNPYRTLREKLDLIEVVDFIWGYLGRNIFKGRFGDLSDWVSWAELQQFTATETPDSAWALFIARVFQELRPPHIIELLLSAWDSDRVWGIDRSAYLRQLGFLVEPESVEEDDDGHTPDTQFSLNALDEYVINSFIDMVGSEDSDICEKQWGTYEDTQWQTDMKGGVLSCELTSQQLFEVIMLSNGLSGRT